MSILSVLADSSLSPVSIGAPLANHLWQSTLCAGVAALLTLLLRKNRAEVRYWLWLTASMKFLVPFALLVSLGSHLGWSRATTSIQARLFVAMEEASQPFTPMNPISGVAAAPTTLLERVTRFLPILLVGVWICGGVTVLFLWWLRRRRIHAALHWGRALESARELELLQRIERSMSMTEPVELIVSKSALEPGVIGIFRPVLLLPEGISERLTDAQLDAILAHELCHVRRRDNLAAAVHMLVEALFWFHPFVWWIGARLVVERERACDEEVLRLGSDPQVYAEGILKVCEFYLESPLACVAGVTGSNLKKRIEAIMMHRIASDLSLAKKLFLSAVAALAVIGPVVFGLFHATQSRAASRAQNAVPIAPAFAEVSIKPNTADTPMPGLSIKGKAFSVVLFKPNRFIANNVTLQGLIRVAYGVQDSQIVGGPDWLYSEKYDVDAKIESSVVEQFSKLSQLEAGLERGHMLQALLADHFKLILHRETRELPSYALVVAESGPKLQQAKPSDTYPNGFKGPDGKPVGTGFFEPEKGKLVDQGLPIMALVNDLSRRLGRTVFDKTGLTGNYDFRLQWTPDTSSTSPPASLSAAIEEQLGLKLESQTSPIEVLVIDHGEQVRGDDSNSLQPQAKNAATLPPAFKIDFVRQNKSGSESSTMNVPVGLGDASSPSGGLFSATNLRLISYIYFAYNLTGNQLQLLMPQLSKLPPWFMSDTFDIQARADDHITKDQMRLMVQSVLADRFKLAAHYETRQLPVFGLVLAKPGETGPQLRSHVDDPPCSTAALPGDPNSAQTAAVDGKFPAICGRIVGVSPSVPGHQRMGARNVPIGLIASTLGQIGGLDRAVLDRTGLSGTFDFTFEWASSLKSANGPRFAPELTFMDNLRQQLGLKLEPQNGPVDVFVIDHVEKPSGD